MIINIIQRNFIHFIRLQSKCLCVCMYVCDATILCNCDRFQKCANLTKLYVYSNVAYLAMACFDVDGGSSSSHGHTDTETVVFSTISSSHGHTA